MIAFNQNCALKGTKYYCIRLFSTIQRETNPGPNMVRARIAKSVKRSARGPDRIEGDGDYNASKNIGKRLVPLLEGKRFSGLDGGHLALESGTSTLNGDYTAYDTVSAEGESHAQTHGFSRGQMTLQLPARTPAGHTGRSCSAQ